ncbi:unnamed protein product [Plutella xylostella]|uniref:(diamondback moth) hypothetical protein n=1 Tax=Plutella xylostella TaxID=51655 RepID=A0A8S4FZT4_PLUXY|nr:unnamed protein product [Plutella xylostella]
MSYDPIQDVDKFREEYESDEQWQLRKAFIERWSGEHPEDRLLCLARVFVNMEFMGCRYPPEVMKEVAAMSEEIAKAHRQAKKGMLQRTFVSASDAAEDRARGVKRQGGVVVGGPSPKSTKINFLRQGQVPENDEEKPESSSDNEEEMEPKNKDSAEGTPTNDIEKYKVDSNEYMKEMQALKCLDVRSFHDSMFMTSFGRMVLLIRPWTSKLGNIQASCAACRLTHTGTYTNGAYCLTINDTLIAQATGSTKAEARTAVEMLAWNRIRAECVSVVIKEQFIAQGDSRITSDDVTGKRKKKQQRDDQFGTPIESSKASKMMKLMGWAGGGLGADAQGIEEPIKPHLQMVNRAGLGSQASDISSLRRSAHDLMRRYIRSSCLDVDLVFSADFSKEERAALHIVAKKQGLASHSYGKDDDSADFSKEERAALHVAAKKQGLASHSYGKDDDRFLVVKKKIDPFSIVRAVVEQGGSTPKYQLFIPATVKRGR